MIRKWEERRQIGLISYFKCMSRELHVDAAQLGLALVIRTRC